MTTDEYLALEPRERERMSSGSGLADTAPAAVALAALRAEGVVV